MIEKDTNKERYKTSRVLLLSHYATTAMQDFLTLYLNDHKTQYVAAIKFPLPEIPLLTHIEVHEYRYGKKIATKNIRTYVGHPSLTYILHFFQGLWVLFWMRHQSFDLVIAQNSLLALIAIYFRRIGGCKRVIFYSHGIAKKRFSGSKMNVLYRLLDGFAYANSDINWALSNDIQISRRMKEQKPIRVIPANVPVALFPRRHKKLETPTLVFIGTLNRMNGADLLPDILKEIHKYEPSFRLDIIGVGSEEASIRNKIKKYSLEKHVRLHGYQDIFTYASKLGSYLCGLAPYRRDDSSLLTTTDPMKIQIYAAAGIPTIVTNGYSFSKRVIKYGAGIVVTGDSCSFAKGIVDIYKDKKRHAHICTQSRLYAEKNDIYKIYEYEFAMAL